MLLLAWYVIRRFCHITQIMGDLHSLPFRAHMNFKVPLPVNVQGVTRPRASISTVLN